MREQSHRSRPASTWTTGPRDDGPGRSGRPTIVVSVALAFALLVAACAGDVDPYRAAVEALPFPAAWQVTKTITRGNGGETGCVQLADPMCPSVTRYYSVPGALPDLYQQARAALVQGGFGDVRDNAPNCDLLTYAASLLASRNECRRVDPDQSVSVGRERRRARGRHSGAAHRADHRPASVTGRSGLLPGAVSAPSQCLPNDTGDTDEVDRRTGSPSRRSAATRSLPRWLPRRLLQRRSQGPRASGCQ